MTSRVQSRELRAPDPRRLKDQDAEVVRRSHEEKIKELQAKPAATLRVVAGVSLADTVTTPVSHGLGKPPTFVSCSVPRGATAAGYVQEIRDGSDRSTTIKLQANGFGATITVDLAVM